MLTQVLLADNIGPVTDETLGGLVNKQVTLTRRVANDTPVRGKIVKAYVQDEQLRCLADLDGLVLSLPAGTEFVAEPIPGLQMPLEPPPAPPAAEGGLF